VSRRRKGRAIAPPDVRPADEEGEIPAAEQVARWEQQHLVRVGLERLGGRCEALLTALYLEPGRMSYEVISRQLQIPVGSIGPTRTRCLKKLLELLEE
jgi:DNA-directed RNA polymerase specialized sigma24 family protein